ncbi:MAG TPA: carboxymuconolactone decarboxylase family protein [Sphingomonadaceae bacterium]|nr:carboxymuconolactone decarboxylase family protein [Sphingomonadaceae bacterium]
MSDDLFQRGMQVRRDMYGPARADDELAAATDFNRPLQELITRYCFGELWDREPLDRKTRSMLTIALCIALNRQGALRAHVEGGLANGVTKAEMREIILHCAIYCGVPAAAEANAVAQAILRDAGLD